MDERFFRHYLAALSYRATVAFTDIPADYSDFQIGKGVKTPVEIVAHMSDVLSFGYSWFEAVERSKGVREWEEEVARFYTIVEKLDQAFASNLPMIKSPETLLQGPLADAMTHVGQLLTLRRLADSPVPPENYIKADIQTGVIRPR
ncbi:hypothetical protein ACXYMX_16200 [Sporosarcina sp. CAU 1771]